MQTQPPHLCQWDHCVGTDGVQRLGSPEKNSGLPGKTAEPGPTFVADNATLSSNAVRWRVQNVQGHAPGRLFCNVNGVLPPNKWGRGKNYCWFPEVLRVEFCLIVLVSFCMLKVRERSWLWQINCGEGMIKVRQLKHLGWRKTVVMV